MSQWGSGRGGGKQDGSVAAYKQNPVFIWCVVQYVYIILLYRTLCTNTYFLRYRQLDVGWVEVGGCTMYDKG